MFPPDKRISCVCRFASVSAIYLVYKDNRPVVSTLELESSVLRSSCTSNELIEMHYVDRQHAMTRWTVWTREVSQDLAYVGLQND